MSKTYLYKRIIKAGLNLCQQRIRERGTPITAEDIRSLKINTLSPVGQATYTILGVLIFLIGIYVQLNIANMALSIALVFFGVGNLIFAFMGRVRLVSQLEDEIDLMSLTADIVARFTSQGNGEAKP